MNEYENKDLIRRRFYLSKASLEFLDAKALESGMSGSLFLDNLLMFIKLLPEVPITASTEAQDKTSLPTS